MNAGIPSVPERGYTFIYALVDPRDGEVRYIGKSNNPERRLNGHLQEANKSEKSFHRLSWLRILIALEMRPGVQILEKVDRENWQERERYWISKFLEEGTRLTNSTDGGEGMEGFIHTPETCYKLSVFRTGRKDSPETCAKKSLAKIGNKNLLGYKHSEETIAKMSLQRKGHEVSDETRVKIGLRGKGKKRSPETCARISLARSSKKTGLVLQENLQIQGQ